MTPTAWFHFWRPRFRKPLSATIKRRLRGPETPAGVYLRPPSGKPIECVLVHQGTERDKGLLIDMWEAMPVHQPIGFGQEPGWRVTVQRLPAFCGVRIALPDDFDPTRIHMPTVNGEGD